MASSSVEQRSSTPPSRRPLDRRLASLVPVVVMLAIMWIVEIVDVPLDGRLDRFGIKPRQLDGLDGIVFSPFLHSGFSHLIGNTVPFALMGGVIALGSRTRFLQVTIVVGVIGGVGTWLTGGSHTLVIGASGLVFGYLLYLVTRGLFARKLSYLVGGVVVFAVYGGVLWGLLPTAGISWQGHLFGALGGVAAASLIHGDHTRDGGTASSAQPALGGGGTDRRSLAP